MLKDWTPHGCHRLDVLAMAMGLLGIAWAHAFLAVDLMELGKALQSALSSISAHMELQELDRSKEYLSRQLEADVACMSASREPSIQVHLRGMVVVDKPPDWEVDGKVRMQSGPGQDELPLGLSGWLRRVLPPGECPVTRDALLDYGFIHRLDVPSSGLILCGTTFTGLMALRWQLDTYCIERQYAVCGHDVADPQLREVEANINPQTIHSRRSFVSEVSGKPAKTWITIPAHFRRGFSRGVCLMGLDHCSAFLVRIRTGRRHQIRAHMLYASHPTVADAKYAVSRITFRSSTA